MRLVRVLTADGPRQALVGLDENSLLPPGAVRIPGCGDPPLVTEMAMGEQTPLLSPVVPSKILCIGRNYTAHAAELGNKVPKRPLLFHKPTSSLIGPGDPILLPPDSERVEHEAELGVVIGRRARHVRPEAAGEVIFGFVCLNDVTARDLQRADGQFARGKGFDTFCPVGPWIETELDPADLAIECEVAGEIRQRSRTSRMVFDVPTLVSALSRVMTLLPGDVIATGTPAGVGPLVVGSDVVVRIEGLGELRNPVERDEAVPSDLPPPISQA